MAKTATEMVPFRAKTTKRNENFRREVLQIIENQKKRNHLHRRDHRLFSREVVPSLVKL